MFVGRWLLRRVQQTGNLQHCTLQHLTSMFGWLAGPQIKRYRKKQLCGYPWHSTCRSGCQAFEKSTTILMKHMLN
ncbi:hypothetical protein HZ326_6435 [Fusarium oxysporum f. sp. albedinis]|nr:hypothetical protein HZ326_6435 [Fusarium oxysporum f. sp. albedinis]